MSSEPPTGGPDDAGPPGQYYDLTPAARPSRWPTVLGTIAIVLSVSQLLCYTCALSSLAFVRESARLSASTAPATSTATASLPTSLPSAARVSSWGIGLSVANLAIYGVLLALGIGLVTRHRWSRPVAIIWAIATLAMSLVAALVTATLESAASTGPASQPTTAPERELALAVSASFYFGLIVWIAMNWAAPVFTLIWFSRRKVRAEIADWR